MLQGLGWELCQPGAVSRGCAIRRQRSIRGWAHHGCEKRRRQDLRSEPRSHGPGDLTTERDPYDRELAVPMCSRTKAVTSSTTESTVIVGSRGLLPWPGRSTKSRRQPDSSSSKTASCGNSIRVDREPMWSPLRHVRETTWQASWGPHTSVKVDQIAVGHVGWSVAESVALAG